MTNMRNPAAGGSGAPGRISSTTKNNPKIPTAAPHFNRRAAFLDAVWDESTIYAAATTAAILARVIGHLRQHPEFDRLGLGRTVDRLVALRDQADDATLHVGRAVVNQAIDEIVAAVANPTTNTFMSFPLKRRDDAAPCGAAKPRSTQHHDQRTDQRTNRHATK
jgi:hypothetical protein